MDVVYFTSDLFAGATGISMLSLMENNKSFQDIHFYVFEDEVTEENKRLLKKSVEDDYKRKLTFLKMPMADECFDYKFKTKYYMGRTYLRLCLDKYLPENVEKVLCLDSDTLIQGDLSEIWNIELGNNVLAGVADCLNVKAYSYQFGLNEDNIYINVGMSIIDVKKWRDEKLTDVAKEYIREKNGTVFFVEQTMMNYICRNRILKLPLNYNCYTLLYAFSYDELLKMRKPNYFYSREEVEAAKADPKLIHFTRNFFMMSRPWIKGCDHSMTSEYQKYKAMSYWPELEEDRRTWKEKAKAVLWHRIPRWFMIRLVNFLYNTVRPKLIWKNT